MLRDWSPRQVRLSFVSQLWNNRVDWNESLQGEVRARETIFDVGLSHIELRIELTCVQNFFVQTKALITEWDSSPTPENGTWRHGKDEKELTAELHRQQHAFRAALCDSFNTPQALQILLDLVSSTNVYLKRGRSSTNIGVVRQVAAWITKMLRMFGLGEGQPTEIGWGVMQADGDGAADVSPKLAVILNVFAEMITPERSNTDALYADLVGIPR